MDKPTHIRIDRVFEVSTRMLSRWMPNKSISPSSLQNLFNVTVRAANQLGRESYALRKYPQSVDLFAVFNLGPLYNHNGYGPLPVDVRYPSDGEMAWEDRQGPAPHWLGFLVSMRPLSELPAYARLSTVHPPEVTYLVISTFTVYGVLFAVALPVSHRSYKKPAS
jgi:hypothetical protein